MRCTSGATLRKSTPAIRIGQTYHRAARVEALERRELLAAQVTDHQVGRIPEVIPHVEVSTIFLGSDWAQSSALQGDARQLNSFYSMIVNSSYMDMLNEYGVSRGTFARSDVANVALSGAPLTEDQIRQAILNEIAAGNTAVPDLSSLYVVYLPPGIASAYALSMRNSSGQPAAGYHLDLMVPVGPHTYQEVSYAVIPFPSQGTPGSDLALESQTVYGSHELAEAVTDRHLLIGSGANIIGVGGGWWDSNSGDEIGDFCAGDNLSMGYFNGFWVQAEWSNNPNLADHRVLPPGTSNPYSVGNGQGTTSSSQGVVDSADPFDAFIPRALSTPIFSVSAGNGLETDLTDGVLSRFSDPNGKSLTAKLLSGPSNGQLTLNADGSFAYNPANGFLGTDSFVVEASDGVFPSLPTTVFVNVTLAAPIPIAPGNGETVTTATPIFQWSAVPGASYYSLTIIDQASPNAPAQAYPTVAGNTLTLPTDLLVGHIYTWNVEAWGTQGTKAEPSTPSSASLLHVAPVGAPSLLAPGNGETVDTTTPRLQWGDVVGAASYDVTIVEPMASSAPIAVYQTTGTSLTVSQPLTVGGQYQWYVQAFDKFGGASGPTAPATFTIASLAPASLSAPMLVAPTNGANLSPPMPVFQWNAVSGAVSYDVYIDNLSAHATPTITVLTGLAGTSYTAPMTIVNPYLNQRVNWWVVAYDSASNPSVTPAPFSFTTGLLAPNPAGPTGVISTYTPTFQWSPVDGATGYLFQLHDDTANVFAVPPFRLTGTSYASPIPLADNHQYTWSVAAHNDNAGFTDLGTQVDVPFQVAVTGGGGTPLDVPELSGPSGPVTSAIPTFTWSAVAGAVGYLVYINDPTGSAKDALPPIAVSTNSYVPPAPLTSGHTYVWWVAAFDGSGDVSMPARKSDFNVGVDNALGTPVLTGPTGAIETLTPMFKWGAASGASDYVLTVIDQITGQAVLSVGVAPTFYTMPVALLNGRTYRWYVAARSNGAVGEAAAGSIIVSAEVPPAPTPLSPSQGAAVSKNTPTLQWTPVEGATNYFLSLTNDDVNGDTTEFPVFGTSYTPTVPLTNDDSYTWTVSTIEVVDGAYISSAESTAMHFTVSVPGTASAIGPSGTVMTHAPTFSWLGVPNAAGYLLTVKDTTVNTAVITSEPVTGNSYVASLSSPSGDAYQWFVQAYDGNGDIGLASQPLAFTIPILVASPNPDGPIGSVQTLAPTFQWQPVSGAVSYRLSCTDTSTNMAAIDGVVVSGNSYVSHALLADGDTFKWSVVAVDSSGNTSAASSPMAFTVAVPPLGKPQLIGPSGIVAMASPTFRWSAAAGASGYYIEVVDRTTGVFVVPLTQVTGTSYTPTTPLTNGDSYQWDLQAYDGAQQQTSGTDPESFLIGANLSRSSISVGSTSLESGKSTTVMLAAMDANGDPETSGGLDVAFTLIGGSGSGQFGGVTDHGDGIYTATFTGGTAGSTSISATIDGEALSAPGVPITVAPGAAPPFASRDTLILGTYGYDGTIIMSGTISVLTNDTSGDAQPQNLTATLVSQAMFGSLALNPDGSFTYTEGPEFQGIDRFTYQVNEGGVQGNTATVTLLSQAAGLVDKLYNQVLHRSVEDSGVPNPGLQFWTGRIQSGLVTIDDVAQGIFNSPERLDPLVTNFYEQYLARGTDPDGLAHWVNDWAVKGDPSDVVLNILSSPEFFDDAHDTNAGFVNLLYGRVLERAADGDGLAYWTQKLDSGQLTRDQVAAGFYVSHEQHVKLVDFLFGEYFANPTPADAEAQPYVADLDAGQTDTQVELAMIDSDTYKNTPREPAAGAVGQALYPH